MTSIHNGRAIGSGGDIIAGAGIAGTTIAMTRGVGITVVEQPQTVATSGNEHSKAKKKRGRRVIPAADAANRSGLVEQSWVTSPRLIQRALALRRLAYSNFGDGPLCDNIITFARPVNIDSKDRTALHPPSAVRRALRCRSDSRPVRRRAAGSVRQDARVRGEALDLE
ncbi:hypothetical protein F6X37_26055 [Paraburkholderia sp. 31.1]|uniref:hypothetical protein n=1 Tax=Paraburkholderia sp. 31.1 TaxID=2615205 RepID=UPI001655423B|nr:hypothetical protein [Paraburkholderia sp. 31.1]MBC8724916.1 hypothetical protein [Paraburkholderia sp. 31.1]